MSRIRSIHPKQWTDEEFVSMSQEARLLTLAIRNECDDQGLFEWKPITIKMRLMPADNVDINALLAEMVQHNQCVRFSHGSREYGAVRNFTKYQRPNQPKMVFSLPDSLREYVGYDIEEDETSNLRKRKCDAQGGLCYYCGDEITHYSKRGNSLEIDHVIPLSKGGSNEDENLVAACRPCNRGKHALSESEWRAKLASRIANSATNGAKHVVAPQREQDKEERNPPTPLGGFEMFWEAWPDKAARPAAERAWHSLSDDERRDATDRALPWFSAWRKAHPTAAPISAAKYLRDKRWNEIRATSPPIDVRAAKADAIRAGKEYLIRSISAAEARSLIEAGYVSDDECRKAGVI